jgi:hypothetical protein
MTIVNLGRIKPVWKNEWAQSTSYVIDDIVRNGTGSYICINAHTSGSVFALGSDWALMAAGGIDGTDGTDGTNVGTGTSGQVLKTNSAGTGIEWDDDGLNLKADQSTTYTKTEVDTNIAGIVDSAPETLNTLNELAAALGDDANHVTTMTTLIGGKVDNAQVLTDVPVSAVFTDTVYTHPTGAGDKHIPSGGASGNVLTYSSSGTATWNAPAAGGLSEADSWCLTSDAQNQDGVFTQNFARLGETGGFFKLGNGMSWSNGIFTFPSTGTWFITYQAAIEGSSNSYLTLWSTTNGSNWYQTSNSRFYTQSTHGGTGFGSLVFDVSSTSTCKVKLDGYTQGKFSGTWNRYYTGITFIKLA